MATINTFVRTYKLEPGDVLHVKQIQTQQDIYNIVYLGFTGLEHRFLTQLKGRGVDWLNSGELMNLSTNYRPINIRKFKGSNQAQQAVILKAVRSMKKYAYHFLTQNKQQLASYAKTGKLPAKQKQQAFGAGVAATGVLMATTSKNEAVQAFGIFAAIAGAIIALSDADE